MKPSLPPRCSLEHGDKHVRLSSAPPTADHGFEVPAIVSAFKDSAEAADLTFSSAEAAHYVDNFLRSMVRVNVEPNQLGIADVFDAVLFVFSHDYVRQYRDRSRQFAAQRVLASLLAYFEFADRFLHHPHVMTARHQIDFSEASSILALAVAQSHARHYPVRNRRWPLDRFYLNLIRLGWVQSPCSASHSREGCDGTRPSEVLDQQVSTRAESNQLKIEAV